MGPHKFREIEDLGLTLSDGTRLSARVWLPEAAEDQPVPAILEYLPYRKRDGTAARDALTHPWFASHGYACCRVDMRGNGDSQGVMVDEYTALELADALEVIDQIAGQPWCDGNLGMMGISWGGFNALQVAALAPEPLKAIITLCSTVDRFGDDIHYKGGCLLGENLGWAGTMLSYSSRPPDPALVGDAWREMWLERLQAEPHLAEVWLEHPHRDAYWQHASVCENYKSIKAATLAVGGWGDAYKNAVQQLVENLDAPAKGIIGPWIHKYPHFAAPEPRIGFLQEALRWWDRWLKGADTGVEDDPDLRLYLMDSVEPKPWYRARPGRWVAQNFREVPTKTLHLNAARLVDSAGPVRRVIDSPADTGMNGGEYCAIWLGPDMPGDQRRDDAHSVTFDTLELDAPLDIVGAPVVALELTADAPVAQIAVRLNDIRPDGKVARITYGVLNLTHRDGSETPTPVPVGEPVRIRLQLDQIAYRVPAGHRLRLSLSNAYWPLIWPAPGKTALRLTGGRLDLPLLAEDPREVAFEPADAAPARNVDVLREPENGRATRIDQKTGTVTLEVHDDFGEIEDLDHGLINGTVAREWWDIHPDDPLSATGQTHWTCTIRRGDWSVRIETFSEISADEISFQLTARIEAYEGKKLLFARNFERVIPRRLL